MKQEQKAESHAQSRSTNLGQKTKKYFFWAGVCGVFLLAVAITGSFYSVGLLTSFKAASPEKELTMPLSPGAGGSWHKGSFALQVAVDSVAHSLGGSLAGLEEPMRSIVLRSALDALTFSDSSPAYFTAWCGTQLLYSPMNPDVSQVDFAKEVDEAGTAFVHKMYEGIQAGQGVLLWVSLPASSYGTSYYSEDEDYRASLQKLQVMPHTEKADFLLLDQKGRPREYEMRILYARLIPKTEWYLAASIPLSRKDP